MREIPNNVALPLFAGLRYASQMTDKALIAFQQIVWDYYRGYGRHDLPWRTPEPDGSYDPYKIMVSEIMLQQTQVSRVIPKFNAFLQRFPDVEVLAAAPLAEVLKYWSGLGYNRRAKFLWQAAQQIVHEHEGRLPDNLPGLVGLPGIGPNTAGAILAYAFNCPVLFIETNIRTVYIHHFFSGQERVADKTITDILLETLPNQRPGRAARQNVFHFAGAMRNPEGVSHIREWYWALMDYGTHLKQTAGNAAQASAHYVKQSAFAGSRRQIRGHVLRLLGQGPLTRKRLAEVVTDNRLLSVLADLQAEGFIEHGKSGYKLTGS